MGTGEGDFPAVTLPQNLLLAERSQLDHIVEAIRKIQAHCVEINQAT